MNTYYESIINHEHPIIFYRLAFVSDEDLDEDIGEMGGSRRERITGYLPSDRNIKSGVFGQIITYLLFSTLFPDNNVKPYRWILIRTGRALGALDYDEELGVDMYKIGEKRVPVFYSGMLSGAHAIDNGSFDRLVWHIKYVLKMQSENSSQLRVNS